MSSRSLAAARARRSGENPPPVSGNRPITSIGSHAAFSQQMPNGMGYNMPPPTSNIRTTQQSNQTYNKEQKQQPNQQQTKYPNGLPFNKLSISDAIGLVTLRLGRVEQWIIDTDHETELSSKLSVDGDNIPGGHSVVDNATLTNIINRLDSLEKNTGSGIPSTDTAKLIEDVNRHTIELSKNTEQVVRFNRELTETKDLLKSFMAKYDIFTNEISQNFTDYEVALGDLEKRLPSQLQPEANINDSNINDSNTQLPTVDKDEVQKDNTGNEDNNIIMPVDLKNVIKQELAKN